MDPRLEFPLKTSATAGSFLGAGTGGDNAVSLCFLRFTEVSRPLLRKAFNTEAQITEGKEEGLGLISLFKKIHPITLSQW